VAKALADALTGEAQGVAVFDHPPLTLNTPALVVGRPTEVLYGVAGMGTDEAQLPVICIGPMEGEDVIDGLIGIVRGVVASNGTLSGVVRSVTAPMERSWRRVDIGGAKFLAADVVLQVQQ
jgi:hypothetical protein